MTRAADVMEMSDASRQRSCGNLDRLARFDGAYFARAGVERLCGIDEAGRGALAGPVVAAAVIVDRSFRVPGLNDSKQLSPAQREDFVGRIRDQALAVATGFASAREIDRINILQATLLAARRALESLAARPDLILTDALKLADAGAEVEPLVKGDARSQAIAAASVVAKVARDRLMTGLDDEYPEYGFAAHKGYGVETHLEALRRHGPSTLHRLTFRGVSWFDRSCRPSRTLTQLLSQVDRKGGSAPSPDALWRDTTPGLPECEFEMLCDAARRGGSRGAAQPQAGDGLRECP